LRLSEEQPQTSPDFSFSKRLVCPATGPKTGARLFTRQSLGEGGRAKSMSDTDRERYFAIVAHW
jgi:hypothetical protein